MKRNKKAGVLLALMVILLLAAVGGTWAYLATGPQSITNVFSPAYVDTEIVESFTGASKSSITIQNKSNIPVFIRVAIAANWVKDGTIVEPWDGSITTGNGWAKHGNYYYYTSAVPAGSATPNLLGSAIVSAPRADGAVLHVDVLHQGIQAEPRTVVQDVWKVDPTSLAGGAP